MKKHIASLICLIVLAIGFTTESNAQYQEPIQEYKIGIAGTSNGLTIPADFRVSFTYVVAYDDPDTTSTGWLMEVQSYTYVDSTYTNRVFNDSIPNRLIFAIDSSYVDSSHKVTMANTAVQLLVDKYGSLNVTRKK